MRLFKSRRQKLFDKYHEIIDGGPVCGATYGYLVRSGDADRAANFKRAYEAWRQMVPLTITNPEIRKEVGAMIDEFYADASRDEDLIDSQIEVMVQKIELKVVSDTQLVRKILSR